jgi:DNA-binding winged helix-turn-helix (wHTH) protein/Tol biopolymer transport system component
VSSNGIYRFEEFALDPTRRSLSRAGVPLSVSQKSFEVLAYLVANAGRVVTKEELLKAIWPGSFVEEGNLSQHVWQLRKVLKDRAQAIVTVPGRGYQFTAAVVVESLAIPTNAGEPATPEIQAAPENAPVLTPAASIQIPVAPQRPLRRWLIWGLAAWGLAAAAVLAGYLIIRSRSGPQRRIAHYEQITQDGHTKYIGGTDGSRVYFSQEVPYSIREVSVSGGVTAPIPVPLQNPWVGDVSPDGSTLLVISQAGGLGPNDSLWSFRILGGTLRPLANGVTATWSPDGTSVVYATANGDIYTIQSDGTGARKLASTKGYVKSLAWSPGGHLIRFSKDGLLWEMNADGSNVHQLLPGWGKSATQWNGQWSGDGMFYFVSDGQIWVRDERSRLGRIQPPAPAQLTFGPTVWDRPAPTRDGTKLIASGRTRRGELVRLDPQSKQFQRFLGGISAEFLTYSHDGKSIAYVTFPEGVLWRANPDGSNPVQLTNPPVYPRVLRWSPDDTKFIFVDHSPQGMDAIYEMPSDGSEKPHRLLPDDPNAETDPSWSPDGSKIAFSTSPNLGASAKSELHILDIATNGVTTIPESNGLAVPRWSPDGNSISAMTLDATNLKIFHVATGQWSNLDSGLVAFPEWSHDSRFIYYVQWKSDDAVFRISVADGKAERVVDFGGLQFTGYYTLWMALDPADNPLMMRDIGSDDIYALTLEKK